MSESAHILVLGAGGHAKVVVSTLRAAGYTEISCFDDNPASHGSSVCGALVRGSISDAARLDCAGAVIAIGNDAARRKLSEELDLPWMSAIHPAAVVDPTAKIGVGTVVFAGAIIQPDAVVGDHVIINTAASVDHDCRVDNYAQICPGVRLAGTVHVGEEAFLGTGAVVAPNVSLGPKSVLGAGAVLLEDLPAGSRAFGTPAKPKP